LALTFSYLYTKDSNVEWMKKNYLHSKFLRNPK
jgi:hypothetical protein